MCVFILYIIGFVLAEVSPSEDFKPEQSASTKKESRKLSETEETRTSLSYRALIEDLSSNNPANQAQAEETIKTLLNDRTTRSKIMEALEAKLRIKDSSAPIKQKLKTLIVEFKQTYSGNFPFCSLNAPFQETPKEWKGLILEKDPEFHQGNGESCALAIANLKKQRDEFGSQFLQKSKDRNVIFIPRNEELTEEKSCCRLAISGPFQTQPIQFYALKSEKETSLKPIAEQKFLAPSITTIEPLSIKAISIQGSEANLILKNMGILDAFQKICETELTNKMNNANWGPHKIKLSLTKLNIEKPSLEDRLSMIVEKNLKKEELELLRSTYEAPAGNTAKRILTADLVNNILLSSNPIKLEKFSDQEKAKKILDHPTVKKVLTLIPSLVIEEQSFVQEKWKSLNRSERDLSSTQSPLLPQDKWEKKGYQGITK